MDANRALQTTSLAWLSAVGVNSGDKNVMQKAMQQHRKLVRQHSSTDLLHLQGQLPLVDWYLPTVVFAVAIQLSPNAQSLVPMCFVACSV